ncbi:MAG: fructosamine kinase family protein [Clostridia bacterium]
MKRASPGSLAAEAQGLEALRQAGARVPAVVSLDEQALVLEYLELESTGDFAALAGMLVAVHAHRGPRYGWPSDNFIGLAPQANGWYDDWAEFFVERRLRPQYARAAANGYALDWLPFERLLAGHRPPPSLLHGDLWRGNVGFVRGSAGLEPVLFDPAVYYGDAECDLAMSELFGGFPPQFYGAYPLREGYERRKHLYNLYHLLNHLNLFGGGYLAQVTETLGLLRRLL